MSSNGKAGFLRSLALVGRARGEVRRLAAFDKKRHTLPDRVTGATQGFLEKLSEGELAEEAEALFQASREQFGYKRKEISLSVGSGFGRLETKDFALEMRCFLDEEDPACFVMETSVSEVSSLHLLESEAFNVSIGSRFDRLRCGLDGRVSVESVIDAVEEDESGEVSVEYPSDWSHCVVRIEGVAAEVFVDGASLELRFGKLCTAWALVEAYGRMGSRFGETAGLERLLG